MSSAMPNALDRSLNMSSNFCCNMSPAGTILNGSMAYLYLPNDKQMSLNMMLFPLL